MNLPKRVHSIRMKMHLFVFLTVMPVASGTSALAFFTSAGQINTYYKRCARDHARNFVSLVDTDFLADLRDAVQSAEEHEDSEPIRRCLTEHGLWERFAETQCAIRNYLNNAEDIKYLYLAAAGGSQCGCCVPARGSGNVRR